VVRGRRPEQLDHGQWASYQRNGFLFLPDFLPPPEVRYLMDDARRVAAELSRVAPGEVRRGPDPGQVDPVFRIHEHSPRAACLVENLQLVAIAEAILGGPVYVHQSHLDFHPEPRRKPQSWRADFEVWHAEDGMPRMRALTCLILLDNDAGDDAGR
jgi:ectoine hydroxylase